MFQCKPAAVAQLEVTQAQLSPQKPLPLCHKLLSSFWKSTGVF